MTALLNYQIGITEGNIKKQLKEQISDVIAAR
jgi:hypothetical protein